MAIPARCQDDAPLAKMVEELIQKLRLLKQRKELDGSDAAKQRGHVPALLL